MRIIFFIFMFFCQNINAGTSCNSYEKERNKIDKFGSYIVTIGDSITWYLDGKYLRCLLRDNKFQYDYKGNNEDEFGFKHDGYGGDSSQDILNKVNKITHANAYFLLIGTNDICTAEQTIINIESIAKHILSNNIDAKFYISTLLPRIDIEANERIQMINKLLLNKNFYDDRIKVIDIGGAFYSIPNWKLMMRDVAHPNKDGYIRLSLLIKNLIF